MTPFYIVNSFYGENDPRNNVYHFKDMPEVFHFVDLVRQEKAKTASTEEIQLIISQPNGKVLEKHFV